MYPYITYAQIAQLVLKPFLYSITVGRRELSDSLLNCIFEALLIGVQYTLSFQLRDSHLKYLVKDDLQFR